MLDSNAQFHLMSILKYLGFNIKNADRIVFPQIFPFFTEIIFEEGDLVMQNRSNNKYEGLK